MTDDSTNNPEPPQVTVRIDLTSQDIRTGIVRLPRQLHGAFPAGSLYATTEGESTMQLSFEPPRELSGLQQYLARHDLRPNDAIILHVRDGQLAVEPFQRSRPEPEPEPAHETDAAMMPGLFGDLPAPPHPEPQLSDEPVPDEPDPELQNGLFTQTPDEGDPDAAGPVQSDDWQPEADPFAAFSTDDDEDFADDFDIPAMPAWSPPAQPASPAAPDEPATAAAVPFATSEFHTVQRRSFVPPGERRTTGTMGSSRPAAAAITAATEEPEQLPAVPEATPGDAMNVVRAHIEDPAAPSIVRASELTRQLGLELTEVEQALRALSQEPESRLSSIRPDYWLLKRRPADS